jgi:hypothetical protein
MARAPHTYTGAILLGLLGFLIIGYGIFQFRHILLGPQIIVETPINGSTLSTPLITIQGSARDVVFLELNGRPIFVDEQYLFNEKLLLFYGYNILTLRARDRFNRETEQTIELVYK